MKFDLRMACDTLYVGLVVDDYTFKSLFEEIKNYLFFPLKVNLTRSRSKYYSCEAVNEEEGFFLFFSPHAGLKNDYATLQLTGKFFREKEHEEGLKEFLYYIKDVVRFQRVDVCLDVQWLELPNEVDNLTLSLGFPVPQYSSNWKNVKLPFETYGRYSLGNFYLNMVSCGKGDLKLRVYDKDLDIFEKYGITYSEYYGFEKLYDKVFRIEYQMRGKSLKEFIENASELGIEVCDLDSLCSAVISLLFYKYEFLYLDGVVENPLYISTSCKRNSTLEGQLIYHKNKHNFHYLQWCNKRDEINEVKQANKEIIKNVKKFSKDESEKISSVFSLNKDNFENAIFDDMIHDLIFHA